MPESNEVQTVSYKLKTGGTTMSQYTVAILHTTSGEVDNPAGANAGKLAGVLMDASLVAEQTGAFAVSGIVLVKIASSVSVGDLLIVADSSGRVKTKGSSNASGTGIVGRAISGNTSANSLVLCQLAIPNEITT